MVIPWEGPFFPTDEGRRNAAETLTRILVVDDEPSLTRSVAALLQSKDRLIEDCTSVAETLARLNTRAYDLLIIDYRLPDASGLAVMDWLLSHERRESTIMISGEESMDAAVGALRRGADDFLLKPYSPEQLRRAVANALQKRHAERNNRLLQQRLHPGLSSTAQSQHGLPQGGAVHSGKQFFRHQNKAARAKAKGALFGGSACGQAPFFPCLPASLAGRPLRCGLAAAVHQGRGHALQQAPALQTVQLQTVEPAPLPQRAANKQDKPRQQAIDQKRHAEKGPPGHQILGGEVVDAVLEDDLRALHLGWARIAQARRQEPAPGQGQKSHPFRHLLGRQLQRRLPAKGHVRKNHLGQGQGENAQVEADGAALQQGKERPDKKGRRPAPAAQTTEQCGKVEPPLGR